MTTTDPYRSDDYKAQYELLRVQQDALIRLLEKDGFTVTVTSDKIRVKKPSRSRAPFYWNWRFYAASIVPLTATIAWGANATAKAMVVVTAVTALIGAVVLAIVTAAAESDRKDQE